MSQQFCLKWNNHMNNMMDVFQNLLSTESMVDVTLACDGLSLKAHKMVLSACSPFFQSLFLENPCQHPIVILKDMKYTELKAIIEFMYHGEVNVAQDQLSALMKTAETLRVKGLAEVTNEKNQSTPQENTRQSHSDAPSPHSKRRKVRNRKRSISGSDYSDSESQPQPKIKQPASPDIEELSGGDISMDASSGQFSNVRQSRVPMQSHQTHSSNSYHKTSSVASSQDLHMEAGGSENESDFGAEPAKLLQQSLTTEDARRSSRLSTMSTSSEPQRRPKSSTDHSMGMSIVPTSLPSDDNSQQQPLSPPDIKPELLELDPPMSPVAGTSHSTENAMVVYGDPGPSTYQDNSALVPQDSQQQGKIKIMSFYSNSLTPASQLGKQKSKIISLTPTSEKGQISFNKEDPPVTIKQESIDSSTGNETSVTDIQKEFMAFKKSAKEREDRLLRILAKKSEIMRGLTRTNSPASETFYSGNVSLPLNSMVEVEIEEHWLNDKNNMNTLVDYLTLFRGHNGPETVRNIMKKVFRKEVAARFNWAGRGDKKAFSSLFLKEAVVRAVLKTESSLPIPEIESTIKLWLRCQSKFGTE